MTVPNRPVREVRDEAAFDRALARAARSLVVAPLPAAVLDAPRTQATRPRLQVGAPLGAAIAIVAIAIGLGIGAPRGPGASQAPAAGQTPAFRSGSQISFDLRTSGYSCRAGVAASRGQLRMEAIVCTRSANSIVTTVIVSEDAASHVGEIHVRSDASRISTTTSEREQSDLLRRAVGLPLADPADVVAVRAWLDGVLLHEAGGRASTTIDGTPVVLQREASGRYVVVLGDLGAGGAAVPSR